MEAEPSLFSPTHSSLVTSSWSVMGAPGSTGSFQGDPHLLGCHHRLLRNARSRVSWSENVGDRRQPPHRVCFPIGMITNPIQTLELCRTGRWEGPGPSCPLLRLEAAVSQVDTLMLPAQWLHLDMFFPQCPWAPRTFPAAELPLWGGMGWAPNDSRTWHHPDPPPLPRI